MEGCHIYYSWLWEMNHLCLALNIESVLVGICCYSQIVEIRKYCYVTLWLFKAVLQ